MTYDQAVAALEGALKFGIDPSLEPMRAMCTAMGNPQERYRCIQVAGTNGKSSTTRMVAALMHAQGLHVGLYVSPHLVKYPERIEVDGHVVSDDDFARAIGAALDAADRADVQATEFELLTAAALWHFAQKDVDWAILECGLGGRWDATSVVTPQVAVITGVALDHTAILGDTIEEIAVEKAAIIKEGGRAVFAHDLAAREVFEQRAQHVGAPFEFASLDVTGPYEDELLRLPAYQRANLATALTAVTSALGHTPSPQSVRSALDGLVIPGRFEILRRDPLVIIDAAHNPQSAHALAEEIVGRFGRDEGTPRDKGTLLTSREPQRDVRSVPLSRGVPSSRPTLLLGILGDKDARGIIRELCPLFSRVVVTASTSPRAIPAPELATLVEEECGVRSEVTANVHEARALLGNEPVIATGSITVAGEVRDIW